MLVDRQSVLSVDAHRRPLKQRFYVPWLLVEGPVGRRASTAPLRLDRVGAIADGENLSVGARRRPHRSPLPLPLKSEMTALSVGAHRRPLEAQRESTPLRRDP